MFIREVQNTSRQIKLSRERCTASLCFEICLEEVDDLLEYFPIEELELDSCLECPISSELQEAFDEFCPEFLKMFDEDVRDRMIVKLITSFIPQTYMVYGMDDCGELVSNVVPLGLESIDFGERDEDLWKVRVTYSDTNIRLCTIRTVPETRREKITQSIKVTRCGRVSPAITVISKYSQGEDWNVIGETEDDIEGGLVDRNSTKLKIRCWYKSTDWYGYGENKGILGELAHLDPFTNPAKFLCWEPGEVLFLNYEAPEHQIALISLPGEPIVPDEQCFTCIKDGNPIDFKSLSFKYIPVTFTFRLGKNLDYIGTPLEDDCGGCGYDDGLPRAGPVYAHDLIDYIYREAISGQRRSKRPIGRKIHIVYDDYDFLEIFKFPICVNQTQTTDS